jgi:acyl-ACP thioesterase
VDALEDAVAASPHAEWFAIYAFQQDVTGVAGLPSLCEYMQEAAGNHAAALGFSIERLHGEGLAWVLARMRVVSLAMPPVHARVEVTTWPVGIEGLQFRRDFIVRGEDGSVLVKALSQWVVVSLSTRKVVRVPAFIAGAALRAGQTALDDEKRRLADAGAEHEACVFRARLADMDRNRHVNNVRYLDWIMESVPEEETRGRRLADLEVAYRAEARKGDMVSVRTARDAEESGTEDAPEGAAVYRHSLVRQSDGKELARARSLWR